MGVRGLFANRLTVQLARKWRNVFIGPDWNAFHRDKIYRQIMMEVLDALPVSSWVETGTWMGDSTQAVAMHRPKLPIYSRRTELRGHILIFQNLDSEFAAFQQRPFVSKYYEAHAFNTDSD